MMADVVLHYTRPEDSSAQRRGDGFTQHDSEEQQIQKRKTTLHATKRRGNPPGRAVRTTTVSFPSNVKLIGPIHHQPDVAAPMSITPDRLLSGHSMPKSGLRRNVLQQGSRKSHTESGAQTSATSSDPASAARYQWVQHESGGGGVYSKTNFWNLHRSTHSRCPSAASVKASASLHNQGSHLSLHKSAAVQQQEMEDYLTITQPLHRSAEKIQRKDARIPAGSFSEYFMSFRPLRTPRTSPASSVSSLQAPTHHSRNDLSIAMSMRVQHLETPRSAYRPESGRGRIMPLGMPGRHPAMVPTPANMDYLSSVVSIQPAARPCTPADGAFRHPQSNGHTENLPLRHQLQSRSNDVAQQSSRKQLVGRQTSPVTVDWSAGEHSDTGDDHHLPSNATNNVIDTHALDNA